LDDLIQRTHVEPSGTTTRRLIVNNDVAEELGVTLQLTDTRAYVVEQGARRRLLFYMAPPGRGDGGRGAEDRIVVRLVGVRGGDTLVFANMATGATHVRHWNSVVSMWSMGELERKRVGGG
jgi:hypothetical protein